MNSSKPRFTQTESFNLLLIAAVAALVMLPVLLFGLPNGYDLPHHLQCAMTFHDAISRGELYPSWSLERNLGFGGLELRLYPPVAHYTWALFQLIANDWHLALWLTLTFYSILGSFGVYFWARELMPARQAVFAACVYACLPYHLTQIYNTFFFAEYVGSAILPFAFLFVARVCKRGKSGDVIGLAIAYAALILTHLPLTVIGSLCLALYAVSFFRRASFAPQLFKLICAVCAGLASSSFFWVKVVEERGLMAKTLFYPDPWLDYRLHFLFTPLQTFADGTPLWVYQSSTSFYDLMQTCAILLALGCTLPFVFLAKKRTSENIRGAWFLFAAAVFLTAPLSRLVWDALPFLQEVQFPWRFVTITNLAAAILAASNLDVLIEWRRGARRPFAILVCGCIAAVVTFSIAQIIRPAPYIEKSETAHYVEKVARDEGFTFWWTIWTRKPIFDLKDRVSVGDRETRILNWTATKRDFTVSAGKPANIRLALFYHPNWQVTINDSATQAKFDDNGALTFELPADAAKINVSFQETFAVFAARYVSLAAALGLFLAFSLIVRRRVSSKFGNPTARRTAVTQQIFRDFCVGIKGKEEFRLFTLFAAALLSVLPVFLFGIFGGGDLPQQAQLAFSVRDSLLTGSLYPSWAANENFGYGGLDVRVYPPLFPFLLAVLRIIGGDWHLALGAAFLFFSVLGSFGVYFLAKEFVSPPRAFLAGLFFLLMPYRLFEINNAAMYAEFAGGSIIPFCFLFVTKICRGGGWRNALALSFFYSLLILTHLPLTVIGSLSLFISALLLLQRQSLLETLFKLTLAVLLSLAATAFFWWRIVTEKDLVRNARFWKDHHFDYDYNFLITTNWFESTNLWYFNLVLLSLMLLVAGLFYTSFLNREINGLRNLRPIATLFALSILMTTILSQPVWLILPPLRETQFPWRWLTLCSVFGSVLIAAAVPSVFQNLAHARRRKVFGQIFAGVTVLIFGLIFTIQAVSYSDQLLAGNKVESWFEEQSRKVVFEWFWTVAAKKQVFDVDARVLAGDRSAQILSWQATEREFVVASGDTAEARVATLFYPYWRSTVNGQTVNLRLADDGAILVPLPANSAVVKIWFQEPLQNKIAKDVSLLAWSILAIAAVLFCFLRRKRAFSYTKQIFHL